MFVPVFTIALTALVLWALVVGSSPSPGIRSSNQSTATPRVARGTVTSAFVQEVREVCRRHGVQRWRGARRRRRNAAGSRSTFSGNMPPHRAASSCETSGRSRVGRQSRAGIAAGHAPIAPGSPENPSDRHDRHVRAIRHKPRAANSNGKLATPIERGLTASTADRSNRKATQPSRPRSTPLARRLDPANARGRGEFRPSADRKAVDRDRADIAGIGWLRSGGSSDEGFSHERPTGNFAHVPSGA